jgi:hypothetical protein
LFDAEYEKRRSEKVAAMRALSFGEDAIAAAIAKEDEAYLAKRDRGGSATAPEDTAATMAAVEKLDEIPRTKTPGIRDTRMKKNELPSARSEHVASQNREGFSRSTVSKAAPSGNPSVTKFGALPRNNPATATSSQASMKSVSAANTDNEVALNAIKVSTADFDNKEYIKGRKDLPPGIADLGEGTFVKTPDGGGIFVAKGVTLGVRVEDGTMSFLTGSENELGIVNFTDAFGKYKKQTPEDLLLSFRNRDCAQLPYRG